MNYTSKILEEAVESLSTLPSIGRKSALRLVLHLLSEEKSKTLRINNALNSLINNIMYCESCHCIADENLCQICKSSVRDGSTICVVETVRDMMAIEDTGQFMGKYHVLGGVISPIDGIGPQDLNIQTLIDKVKSNEVVEVIMAISPTIEGDTTIYYISKQLESYNAKISTIARGVSFGGELEYADELTLGRSIATRISYTNTD